IVQPSVLSDDQTITLRIHDADMRDTRKNKIAHRPITVAHRSSYRSGSHRHKPSSSHERTSRKTEPENHSDVHFPLPAHPSKDGQIDQLMIAQFHSTHDNEMS